MLFAGEKVEGECWNDKQNEIGHKTNNHHPLAAIKLVIDKEAGQIIANERYCHVNEVILPGNHDRCVSGSDYFDEFVLEKFISIEKVSDLYFFFQLLSLQFRGNVEYVLAGGNARPIYDIIG